VTTILPVLAAAVALAKPVHPVPLDVHSFQVLGQDYDPENPHPPAPTYYRVIEDGAQGFIQAVYLPPKDTVTLFRPVPDDMHRGVRLMQWRWRAQVLPRKGNECAAGLGDSAAAVYVTWKRGLRWYSLKFIWSTDAPVGATCNKQRNPLLASDSIVLRAGPSTGGWVDETIDPEALFRQHFLDGDPKGDIPELQGIGLMSDGDQTKSMSAADYGGFVLYK
jgi:hypothetical protein